MTSAPASSPPPRAIASTAATAIKTIAPISPRNISLVLRGSRRSLGGRGPGARRLYGPRRRRSARLLLRHDAERSKQPARPRMPSSDARGGEETPDSVEIGHDRARRQRREEPPAVASGPQARVEDRDDPVSSRLRIRRPKPWRSCRIAVGTEYSPNQSPPSAAIRSQRAWTSGSSGGANGSLSITSSESDSPGTSTPCQNVAVATSTESTSSPEPLEQPLSGSVSLTEDRDTGSSRRDTRRDLLERPVRRS